MSFDPLLILRQAIEAVPATGYALGVAGVVDTVAIVASFSFGPFVAVIGTVIMFVLMVALLVFAHIAGAAEPPVTDVINALDETAFIMVWVFTLLLCATAIMIFTVTFLGEPRTWQDIVGSDLATPGSVIRPIVSDSIVTDDLIVPDSIVIDDMIVMRELLVSDISEAYLFTGRKLTFFNEWGYPPALHTLRVHQNSLIFKALNGSEVSISVDKALVPIPTNYNSDVIRSARLTPPQASRVSNFFSAHSQFREALGSLSSVEASVALNAFIEAHAIARGVMIRGREALCSMGIDPPRMYPEGSGWVEPVPPHCQGLPQLSS